MELLTTLSQVQCMHGGTAQVPASANQSADAGSGHVLVDRDIHLVSGCPFVRGSQPSPCVRIEWKSGAVKVTAGKNAALTRSSIGTCYAADGSTQGLALIANTQTRAGGL